MELLTRYLYNSKKYNSQYGLRQAIFENQRVAFGEFTPELMRKFSITEEKYNPEDEMTDEELAARVRIRRDSLISRTSMYNLIILVILWVLKLSRLTDRLLEISLSRVDSPGMYSGLPFRLSLVGDKGLATVSLAKVGV